MVFKKYQSAYEKHWQKIAREIKNISDFGSEDFEISTSPI
jgi:predicted transport protein